MRSLEKLRRRTIIGDNIIKKLCHEHAHVFEGGMTRTTSLSS